MADAASRFAAVMEHLVARLPFGLSRVLAPTLLGFAVINATTFGVDIATLTLTHSGLRWPLPLCVTLSYGIAFGLSYVLNRIFNFRSHGDVRAQVAVYVPVVVVNYLVWVLGTVELLTRVGIDYRLARLGSACCEAAFMYLALRFLVFRQRTGRPAS